MTADPKDATLADPIVAAQLVLSSLGVSLEDLVEHKASEPKFVPTFTEYVPEVAAATPPSSRGLWISYWRILEREWGDRRITEPTASDLEELSLKVQERAAARSGSRGGTGARSNFTDAVKRFYRLAVRDKYVAADSNPAAGLRRPTQLRSRRRALAPMQLAEITEVAGTTGGDPVLDTLVLRHHTETACRRSGVVNLRNIDLNVADCTIWIREKGTVREQPVSRTLMYELLDHSHRRNPHGAPHDQVLRRLDGRPLTNNYYQWLWQRLGKHLNWVAQRGVSAHWIRYTTLNWVERNFGYAVAAAFAGHAPGGSRAGDTLTYVEATLAEVATALAVLVCEAHPLALPGYPPPTTAS
ncbi:integrase [Amycolatopsis lexingtonensis]|uniref:Integrase n=1 Tax=Amycolatopsis lexingtonensis TaxID=218822 RepID=A0ABR9HQL1_9PSEU|nr:site-specific integrase [Amycolatopsis lexingtonensis]MBE1493219.1 integrase [Amycolatopsis lexingtonensis]